VGVGFGFLKYRDIGFGFRLPTQLYPVGGAPVEFRGDLWPQKTRVPGLSCGVVCVILRLAVLVEH